MTYMDCVISILGGKKDINAPNFSYELKYIYFLQKAIM